MTCLSVNRYATKAAISTAIDGLEAATWTVYFFGFAFASSAAVLGACITNRSM